MRVERLLDALAVGRRVAHRDVRRDGAGEQEDVLRHHREAVAQLARGRSSRTSWPRTRDRARWSTS